MTKNLNTPPIPGDAETNNLKDDATMSTPHYQQGNNGQAAPRQQNDAWKQQQRAYEEYAREARRNGYPGYSPYSTETAGQAPLYTGQPWYNNTTWVPQYRKGPNIAAIVWGGISLFCGAAMLVWFFVPTLFVQTNITAIVLSIGFGGIGLALVIGAIVSSFSGLWKKNKTSGTKEGDAPKDFAQTQNNTATPASPQSTSEHTKES